VGVGGDARVGPDLGAEAGNRSGVGGRGERAGRRVGGDPTR